MKNILAQSKWWFLERLDYVGALLVVEVVEGREASVSKNVSIDAAGMVPDARPIEVTDQSRRVRIQFSNVLVYQVTDESYGASDLGKTEEIDGKTLCQHNESAYLRYVLQSTLIEHLVDDRIRLVEQSQADLVNV